MLDIVNVAVVQNGEIENHKSFKQALDYISDEDNEERMFNCKYVSEEEASNMLEKDEIAGYIIFTELGPKVVVNKNGVNQTVIKFAVDEIYQAEESYDGIYQKVEDMLKENSGMSYEEIATAISNEVNGKANIKDTSRANLSYTMIEYYTLIAMTCMYGGIIGAVAISWMLANMTNIGKRTSVSPASKIKMLLSTCLASFVTQLIGIALLFAFTILVLKTNYGSKLLQIVLLSVVGCLAGLSLGLAVSTVVKSGEGKKTGIILAITMTGCFLAGMMGVGTKYSVDKNIPILNKINPVNMITDGFYSLYYYDTLDRFFFNLASLTIFSALMLAVSIITLRRQKYDSI